MYCKYWPLISQIFTFDFMNSDTDFNQTVFLLEPVFTYHMWLIFIISFLLCYMLFLLCILLLCRTWWFCFLLSADPPVRAQRPDTVCSHQVCLFALIHSFTRPRVSVSLPLVFADFRWDKTHNGPSVSEAFMHFPGSRYREASSGLSLCVASPVRSFFHRVHKLINTWCMKGV